MTAPALERRWIFTLITVFLVLAFCFGGLAIAEYVARDMETGDYSDFQNVTDPVMGWLPKPGHYRYKTQEFNTRANINALNMNDHEWTNEDAQSPVRVLAVGDSHTFAVGASTGETWPKRLEAQVFPGGPKQGVIMNAGVIGYSVGQYLYRYRLLRDEIKPTTLLVGFSLATDVYDLVPPEHGGFIYGGDADRMFFDIGPDGKLIERVYRKASTQNSQKIAPNPSLTTRLVNYLGRFALYRRLKRSSAAMTVATYLHPGGNSLWPGMDTALKRKLSPEDSYRWRLAELIIEEMSKEAKARGTQVVLINIPYVAQVYDSVWSASFGHRPGIYERFIPSARLKAICDRYGVTFVDTTQAFVEAARTRNHWLHWQLDGHPTPEGQQLIADVVARQLRDTPLLKAPATAVVH